MHAGKPWKRQTVTGETSQGFISISSLYSYVFIISKDAEAVSTCIITICFFIRLIITSSRIANQVSLRNQLAYFQGRLFNLVRSSNYGSFYLLLEPPYPLTPYPLKREKKNGRDKGRLKHVPWDYPFLII